MEMELLEAIKSRKSIRAYKLDSIPRKVLTELLEVATHAPSGSNTQPWEFIVLTGETLGDLNRAMIERLHSGKMRPEPDEDMPFSFPTGLYKERSAKFYKKVNELLSGLPLATRTGTIHLIACGLTESLLRNWLRGVGWLEKRKNIGGRKGNKK